MPYPEQPDRIGERGGPYAFSALHSRIISAPDGAMSRPQRTKAEQSSMPIHAVQADRSAGLSGYDAVCRHLAALGSTPPDADRIDNHRFLRGLSARSSVTALLSEILADDHLLATIAARSYRHVNHFDKIVLVEEQVPDGYRLTLHLWDPPYSIDERDDELIHDHRFSFWSAILTGTLRSREFDFGGTGPAFNHYRYSPDHNSEYNSYAYQGVVRLVPRDRLLEKTSEVYFLPYDTTHRVLLPDATMTCTLVLRSPRARGYSNVYNSSYPATDTSCSNRMFTRAELAARLVRLRARIAGHG